MTPAPPTPNYLRQRKFRERNPGYYARLQAKRRASEKAARARHILELQAQAQTAQQEPLMLPAPVENLDMLALDALRAKMQAEAVLAAQCAA